MTKVTMDGAEYWDMDELAAYAESIGRPVKRTTLDWYRDVHRLIPDAHIGATALFLPATAKALLDHKKKAGRKKQAAPPHGYYSVETLAEALGITPQNVRRYLRVGAITPDYVPTKGRNKGNRFFNEATMQAMKRGEHRLRQPRRTTDDKDESDNETSGFDETEV